MRLHAAKGRERRKDAVYICAPRGRQGNRTMEWLGRQLAAWNQQPAHMRYLVPDREHCIEIELTGPHDKPLMQALYAQRVAPGQDPHLVYERLREAGAAHYDALRSPLPLDFTRSVLAAMFTAPWTTDAYLEYVLDVFD